MHHRRTHGTRTRRRAAPHRFEYRAALTADVEAERVSAQPAKGILTVIIPKAQAAKPRHIEITT
ncbi:Hsp20 family protein [Streptomyces sp. IMTB 2501]|uniref:Hsp20 family protein n=1 Tax=Streptomyces sp. IMTB 2501 TaxID=1776340 RepID=UPI002116F171|nr:Hsp20 family protein [Streptomyces sp. IMTB 2501]